MDDVKYDVLKLTARLVNACEGGKEAVCCFVDEQNRNCFRQRRWLVMTLRKIAEALRRQGLFAGINVKIGITRYGLVLAPMGGPDFPPRASIRQFCIRECEADETPSLLSATA